MFPISTRAKTRLRSKMIVRVTLTFLLFGALLATLGSACFSRNCPKGRKKRSVEEDQTISASRKCMACGPSGRGQCVGPNICCASDSGCYINTAESAICIQENDIPTPCEVEGATCDNGHCVADSVCCNEEQCIVTNCKRRKGGSRNTVTAFVNGS